MPGKRCRPALPPERSGGSFSIEFQPASTSATVASSTAFRIPCCAAMLCTSRSTRSMFGAPANNARAAEDGRTNSAAAAAYSRTVQGVRRRAELDHRSRTQRSLSRCIEIGVNRLLDGHRRIRGHAATLPLTSMTTRLAARRTSVTLSLTGRPLDRHLIVPDRLDLRLHLARIEVCWSDAKRAALKLVGSVTCSTLIFLPAGGLPADRVRKRQQAGFEVMPDRSSVKQCVSLSVASPGMRFR